MITAVRPLVGLLFFAAVAARAQPEEARFGQVSLAELRMTEYPPDSGAAAVVLFDVGRSEFNYLDQEGFVVAFERQTRIKILTKAGYDQATITVPTYQDGSRRERFQNLKGCTYHLEGGQVVKTKLDKEGIFEEVLNKNVVLHKFTLPNVKEGAVLEFSYQTQSPFYFNFQPWEFQSEVPTAWSEYTTTVPAYFHYKRLSQGYEPYFLFTNEIVNVALDVPGQGTSNPQAVRSHFVMKDVPALREEPHMTTTDDYVSRVDFELNEVSIPGHMQKKINPTWDKLNETLVKDDDFGRQLTRTSHFDDDLARVLAGKKEPAERMTAVYQHVKQHLHWNKQQRSIWPSGPLRKAYGEGVGNVADVNLTLVAMLRAAGFDAAPVLMSTRDHGRVNEFQPMISKFNYVVAHVRLGEESYLLDATDPFATANVLPVRCLNGNGWRVGEQDAGWVPLQTKEKYMRFTNGQWQLGADGQMTGRITTSTTGYDAQLQRHKIERVGEEEYTRDFARKLGDWQLNTFKIHNAQVAGEALKCEYALTGNTAGGGGRIYLMPMMMEAESENPFKNESRKFPVDLGAPIEQTYVATFTLPAEYLVEELPASASVSIPGNGARFVYQITSAGNQLQVVSRLQLNKFTYVGEEYHQLRELFHLIVAKQAEPIVLKRN